MKKPLMVIATSAALGLAAAPALAQTQAQPRGGFIDYITGQLAWSDVDGFDNALALVVAAGKTLPDAPNFSIEGELTASLTEPEADVAGTKAEATYWTLGGYGVYALPLNEDFAVRGRLGVLYRNIDVDFTPGGSDDDQEFGVSFGVGALYDLSPRMNLIAEYTRIDEDINHISAGVQFKF